MKGKSWISVVLPIVGMIFLAIVIITERAGVINYTQGSKDVLGDLKFTQPVDLVKECLILKDDTEDSNSYSEMMGFVLDGMKVGYDMKNIKEVSIKDILKNYQQVIVTFANWDNFGSQLEDLSKWIRDGGNFMNTMTPEPNESFFVMAPKLGVLEGGNDYTKIRGIRINPGVMIGAEGDFSTYSFVTAEEEAMDISLNVILNDQIICHIVSDDGKTPIMWSGYYGKGKYVLINESIIDKFQRGFLCCAYSMLCPVCVYPVINASAYYLDDFPAPIPGGDSKYIKRDYGINTADFYSSVWLPDILSWENKYGIYHTGLIIENYTDCTKKPFPETSDYSQFKTPGNLLLNNHGELGFHGYNHQPLCLKGTDENRQLGTYKLWDSLEDMKDSLKELNQFAVSLFPKERFSVYVPPSNIMSDSGKKALKEACPQIKVIAGAYLDDVDGKVIGQEFGVDSFGFIETPRITSGGTMGDYDKITALSELNFHYVQSHFMHPDDMMDVDRGASLGWKTVSKNIEQYINWIESTVPDLRNVTGSMMGRAVLEYGNLSVQRNYSEKVIELRLGGFSGEAQFLMRVNEGTIGLVEGADYKKIMGTLYSLTANSDRIIIYMN